MSADIVEKTPIPYPEVDAFAERMRAEMIANAGKGDRWRGMSLWQAWCEISWHVGKMTGAIKAEDIDLIRELAADVANGALMLDEIARAAEHELLRRKWEARHPRNWAYPGEQTGHRANDSAVQDG